MSIFPCNGKNPKLIQLELKKYKWWRQLIELNVEGIIVKQKKEGN